MVGHLTPYYEDELTRLYCGDAADVLPTLERASLILTDPPYGIDIIRSGVVGVRVAAPLTQYKASNWDAKRICRDLLDSVIEAGRRAIIFGGNYYADALPASGCWLVWDKGIPRGFGKAQVELAWTNIKTYSRNYHVLWNGMIRSGNEDRMHPTQKPLALMVAILEDMRRHHDVMPTRKKQHTVLDPFAGSGTTLVACKSLGIKSVGVELDQDYCDVAVERLQATNQLSLSAKHTTAWSQAEMFSQKKEP
jgi:DNA modification methylase